MKKTVIFSLIPVFLFFLSGCSGIYSEPPDAVQTEKVFTEYKEDFQAVADFLIDTYAETPDFYSVYIKGDTLTLFCLESDGVHLDSTDTNVSDTPIADSYKRLKQAGCLDIGMDIDGKDTDNAVCFRMWARDIKEADSGIAYSVNGTDPPSIQFQTVLQPLPEQGWYYYLADYEEWRSTKSTYISE